MATKEEVCRGLIVSHPQLGIGKIGMVLAGGKQAWVHFLFSAPELKVEVESLTIINAQDVLVAFGNKIQSPAGITERLALEQVSPFLPYINPLPQDFKDCFKPLLNKPEVITSEKIKYREGGRARERAEKLLANGHGRVMCKHCNDIILTCKCMKCADNIQFDTCDKCAKLTVKAQFSGKPVEIVFTDHEQKQIFMHEMNKFIDPSLGFKEEP